MSDLDSGASRSRRWMGVGEASWVPARDFSLVSPALLGLMGHLDRVSLI